jgi:hypothetical protein
MVDEVHDTYGEAAVHTSLTAVATNVSVVIERSLSQRGEAAAINAKSVILAIRKSELATVPRRGETVAVASTGETFVVDQVFGIDEFEYRVIAA